MWSLPDPTESAAQLAEALALVDNYADTPDVVMDVVPSDWPPAQDWLMNHAAFNDQEIAVSTARASVADQGITSTSTLTLSATATTTPTATATDAGRSTTKATATTTTNETGPFTPYPITTAPTTTTSGSPWPPQSCLHALWQSSATTAAAKGLLSMRPTRVPVVDMSRRFYVVVPPDNAARMALASAASDFLPPTNFCPPLTSDDSTGKQRGRRCRVNPMQRAFPEDIFFTASARAFRDIAVDHDDTSTVLHFHAAWPLPATVAEAMHAIWYYMVNRSANPVADYDPLLPQSRDMVAAAFQVTVRAAEGYATPTVCRGTIIKHWWQDDPEDKALHGDSCIEPVDRDPSLQSSFFVRGDGWLRVRRSSSKPDAEAVTIVQWSRHLRIVALHDKNPTADMRAAYTEALLRKMKMDLHDAQRVVQVLLQKAQQDRALSYDNDQYY